jgi:hypothetical protein
MAPPTATAGAAGRRGRAAAQPRTATTAEQHAEWLALLSPEGPFLVLPVLVEAFPQGLDTVPAELRDRLRLGWQELADAPDLLGPAWHELIVGELLRYPASARSGGSVLPAEVVGAGTRPDTVLYGPEPGGGRAPRLHLYRFPAGTPLTTARSGEPPPAERAAQLCRDTRTPLALLTDDRYWVLVHARPGEPPSTATFDADLWLEEPALLRAFATLLAAPRLLPAPALADGTASTSLAGLFVRSADAHTKVTTTLGGQVRQAVELFVGELARLDREAAGTLLGPVTERDIYRGALTVLMRLVFLLYAEEQRLLPVTGLYAEAYAASTLYTQLDADLHRHGEDVLDRRAAAWPRLLALSAAVHGGCEHPDLRIPAHGGSLFDPARFGWLARAAVTDRVIYQVLDALLMLRHRGKVAERLSYSGLDVEQIGHVYEGLLEFSCRKIDEPFLGLAGKLEPEVPLADLEDVAADDPDRLPEWLVKQCGLTGKQVTKALDADPAPGALADLHAACDNDAALAERARPFLGLLRRDLRGLPTVYPAGSVLFTQVGDRRATGTHYTPRRLAEEIVLHTLDPLCYSPGPADGVPPDPANVRPAADLLRLKVLDPAMGSGAFLVSACRYLAERVVTAWERDGVPADAAALAGPDGSRDDLLLAAARLVAARCLHGVDRDDMAVELAKLSLWLVTLAKGKPFGFLDHALRCGDSLVGLVRTDQLTAFHLDPGHGRTLNNRISGAIDDRIDAVLTEMIDLRESIEATVVDDARQAADKADKLRRADELADRLRIAADSVVAAALSTAEQAHRRPWDPDDEDTPDEKYDDLLNEISDDVMATLDDYTDSVLEQRVRGILEGWLRGPRTESIRPLHWPLEFPEVMRRGGFEAVVGNPPFIGGKRVSGALGTDLREYLKKRIAHDKPGNADLCSYFLLRDLDVTRPGRVGIIATNTIAQGETREVGLDQALDLGWNVYRATKSQVWPGAASVDVSLIWVGHAGAAEKRQLNGRPVQRITPSLDPQSRVTGRPSRLKANADQAHMGSLILGTGFLLAPEAAQRLIARDGRNRNVLFPYLNGEDLNTQFDCSARRWVINFHDWPIERARTYPDCFAIVEREVKPTRDQNKKRAYKERWWRFGERQSGMLQAIDGLDRVLAIALVSKIGLPLWVPTGQVLSHALGVFAVDQNCYLSLLSSSIHFGWWTTKSESTLETRLRYTPSEGFETFPQPDMTARMDRIGAELDGFRRSVMLGRQLGLTKLYNLVHDESVNESEVERLREIHVEVDEAVAQAYGWTDLDLGHGFHRVPQGTRFTIAPSVQVEILDRLLELNHKRHAEEVAQGITGGKRRRAKTAAAVGGGAGGDTAAGGDGETFDGGLFPVPDALF